MTYGRKSCGPCELAAHDLEPGMLRSLQTGFDGWQRPPLEITEPLRERDCYDNYHEAFSP